MTSSAASEAGALAGTRVIEVGSLIAGPFAGRMLGDMGADVIKIEAPDRPDPLRDWGQAHVDGHRLFWTVHARNKRCVTLDLRTDQGRDMFLDLVESADVMIESFRPGTIERWGLGFEVLQERNQGLVLARVSGYGQTGPESARGGYASVAEAASGLRYANGYPDQPPPRMAVSIGDSLGGLFALQGILAALIQRYRTGVGQVIDVALTESCLAVLESTIPDYDATGHVRQPSGTRLEGLAPSNLYQTSDAHWVIIAANQDTVFRRLCGVMGQPELADDERFVDHVSRGRNQDDIDKIVADWAQTLTAAHLTEILEDVGVVSGPVNTVADVMRDPQFISREMFIPHFDERINREVLGPGVVPKMSGSPGVLRWAGPATPGSHNREVYGEVLGLSDEAIDGLRHQHVI